MSEKKCVILSFGFDSSVVLRAYSNYNLGSKDCLVLVVPEEENLRADAAVKDVESFLYSLKSRGVNINLEILKVDASSIEKTIMAVADFMKENEDYTYSIEATGGLRSVCVALTILGCFFKTSISSFHTINDASGQIIEVPLPNFDFDISDTKKEVIRLLYMKEEASAKYIASWLNKDISTVNRHLSDLEKNFVVKRDTRYKANYRLTYIGKLLIKSDR